MMSKLGIALAATVACATSIACTSSVLGTGDDPNGGATSPNPGAPSGSATGSAPAEQPPTASGAPLEIEGLFAPPETDTVTPDSIFGLWAGSGSSAEDRIRITSSDVTFAQKCKADGKIAWVTVKVRASEAKITILESKTARVDYSTTPVKSSCVLSIGLEVGEWNSCKASTSSDCFSIYGNKMDGLTFRLARGVSTTQWLKLAD